MNGSFRCVKYKGDLELFRHGFVKTQPGIKHFRHADGTPFFYLGDTHWNMLTEEYDSPGSHTGDTGAESHFKYIVDRRVEQGFTVYQSEPIGAPFKLQDGTVFFVDGQEVFNRDGSHSSITAWTAVNLEKGQAMKIHLITPGGYEGPLPADRLFIP